MWESDIFTKHNLNPGHCQSALSIMNNVPLAEVDEHVDLTAITTTTSSKHEKAHRQRRLIVQLAQDRAHFIDLEADGLEVDDGTEQELLQELDYLVGHVKALIASKAALFRVKNISRHRHEIKGSPMGRAFLRYLEVAPLIENYFHHHRLHPHFTLFKKAVSALQPGDVYMVNSDTTFGTPQEAAEVEGRLTAAVDTLRRLGLSKKFVAAHKNFQRSSDKNYQQLLAYVRAHSEKTGRLLIGRCDVGVGNAAAWFHKASKLEQLKCLHKARNSLFAFIRQKFGKPFLGFAWKLEFGLKRGFHFHLMFLFNGRDLKSDITIVRMIGEFWKKELMRGNGTYYNCNAFKESYKVCGIGPYSKNTDPGKWEGIELMCAYLTKPDDLVRLHFQSMRTFGKGNLPKAEPKESKTMAQLAAGL